MTEKHGVATRLMYQLYVALNNKKKSNLTGVAMETMRPAAPAKLNAVESGIYKEVSAIKNEIFYFIDYIVIEIRPNLQVQHINYKKSSIFDIPYYLHTFNACHRKMIFLFYVQVMDLTTRSNILLVFFSNISLLQYEIILFSYLYTETEACNT